VLASHGHDLTKNNIRDLPLSDKLQSDLTQLEHRTPGVGVENGITPCRLSARSMLSSVEATLGRRVGALGSDEQIFGADEQVPAGLVQKMHSVSN
jgi:hypothetical protein